MAIYATSGVFNGITAILTPTPKLVATVGNVYVAGGGGGGSVTLTSSDLTIGITGANNNFNLVIAGQGATAGQIFQYNGTKWVPATLSIPEEVYAGAGAPTANPVGVTRAVYYDTVSNDVYIWIQADLRWALSAGGGTGANYLYQLRDVSVQETGGTWGSNLVTPPSPRIVGYTDTTLSLNSPITVNVGDRIGAQNTDPSQTLVVTGTGNQGPLFVITVATGGIFADWTTAGTLTQAIFVYTPTVLAQGRALVWDGVADWRDAPIVNALQVNGANNTTGNVNFINGTNTTVVRNANGTIQINATGGGGGGAFESATSIWTGGTASKDAYTTFPTTINNQGITINLVASSGSGEISGARVSLNGVQLAGTYATTGSTFPNYSLIIPVGDLTGNVAETTASVTVSVVGSFNGSNFNISNAGTLINVQPTTFTASLSAVFSPATTAYYNTTATANYQYTTTGTVVTYAGSVVGVSAPNANGTITISTGGGSITGTVTGNGLNGAPSGVVVPLSGAIGPISTYIPAFFTLTTNSTPPTFTTSSTQTAGGAPGSLVTFPIASATTNYAWIATTLPLARILFVSTFGNSPFVPDVTAPTQVILGQTFNVFGVTGTSTTTALQLQITAS